MGHDPYSWTVLVPSLDGTNESWPLLLHRFSLYSTNERASRSYLQSVHRAVYNSLIAL